MHAVLGSARPVRVYPPQLERWRHAHTMLAIGKAAQVVAVSMVTFGSAIMPRMCQLLLLASTLVGVAVIFRLLEEEMVQARQLEQIIRSRELQAEM